MIRGDDGRSYGFESRIYGFALIIIGAVILLWPALLNGFPLIFHDTNSYVRMTPELPRSYFYKLFVYLTGFRASIWTTAVAQSLIASTAIWCFLRLMGLAGRRYFLATIAILAVGSSLPIYASFIMPDLFTGLMFMLLFALLFLSDNMSPVLRALAFVMLVLAMATHSSHLVLALAITLLGAMWQLLQTPKPKPLGALLALAAIVTVALCFYIYHGRVHHRYALSPTGSTFLMANLLEYGPAREELIERCPQIAPKLCAYRTQLRPMADNILWDADSPFNTKLGGFDGVASEARQVDFGTITDHPGLVFQISVRNSASALIAADPTADIERMDRSVQLLRHMFQKVYGGRTVRSFDASVQEHNAFPGQLVRILNGSTLALLMAVIVVVLAKGARSSSLSGGFVGFSLLAYVMNAVLCATVSGVHDRYQARLSWVVVLALLLLLFDLLRHASRGRQQTNAVSNGPLRQKGQSPGKS